jgi:hypothetical protein
MDPSLLRGYLGGLTLSTAGSSATFGVSAGVAVNSNQTDFMKLTAALSKTTSAWAVGNAGSLDTGAIANNTWYHGHLIKNPTNGVVDALVSLSVTAPALPSGYTLFRRIGSMKTNASGQWQAFIQLGDEFLWSTPTLDLSSVNLTTSASLLTLNVPSGIQVSAILSGYITSSSVGQAYFSSPDQADIAPPFSTGQIPSASGYGAIYFFIRTNTAQQIRARGSVAITLNAGSPGWIDRRGRDD